MLRAGRGSGHFRHSTWGGLGWVVQKHTPGTRAQTRPFSRENRFGWQALGSRTDLRGGGPALGRHPPWLEQRCTLIIEHMIKSAVPPQPTWFSDLIEIILREDPAFRIEGCGPSPTKVKARSTFGHLGVHVLIYEQRMCKDHGRAFVFKNDCGKHNQQPLE